MKYLGQVSYGGVQLRGLNPRPTWGKAGLRKHLIVRKFHIPRYPMRSRLRKPDSENTPYFRKKSPNPEHPKLKIGYDFIKFPWNRAWFPSPEIIPYFREIWWNHTLFQGNLMKSYPISGKFDEIIPYFREIWWNDTLFQGNLMKSYPILGKFD